MAKPRKYTKEFIEPYVKSVKSTRQLIQALDLQETGGNYANLKRVVNEFNIDISHFESGTGWSKGKTLGPKRPLSEYLNNKHYINSDKLKKRLIKEGYFEHKCQKCGLAEWLDAPIPLELHHKDCNHSNNNLNNLSILCPNCHAYEHK